MAERPPQLGIDVEWEIGLRFAGDFLHIEAVEAHQPVRLIQTMLAHEGWSDERQSARCTRDGTERRVINAPQTVLLIHRRCLMKNRAIVCRCSADNHLRALPGRRK